MPSVTLYTQAGADATFDTPPGGRAALAASLPATYVQHVSADVGETSTAATARLNAALALGGTVRLSGDFTTNAPLVVPSGTTIDAYSATITLAASSHCNMLRNEHYASGDRDTGITIMGGTWARGANGGTGNANHSLFLRRIDDLKVYDITYTSSGGKYGLALGDVTNFTVRGIRTNCSSDSVHITGPATDGLIQDVRNTLSGDDVVAFTTTDYTAYDDVHGAIRNVTVRNVSGSNSTRIVLVSGSANNLADLYDISGIVIEDVQQYGAGAAVSTNSTYTSAAVLADLTIRRAFGGTGILLKHHRHNNVVIENCLAASGNSTVTFSVDLAAVNTIDRIVVRDCKRPSGSGQFLICNSSAVTVGTLVLENITDAGTSAMLGFLSSAGIASVIVRGCIYTGTSDFISVGGSQTITNLSVTDSTAYLASGFHCLTFNSTVTVTNVSFTRCTVGAVNTSSGILVNKAASGSTVTNIVVESCILNAIGRCLEVVTGSSGTVNLTVANTVATGCNRLAQVQGGTVNFNYSNVNNVSGVNQPIRVNGASANIRGAGWYGYTASAVVRAASEVIHVIAPDFPADLAILTKTTGDTARVASAVGTLIAQEIAVTNGTTWKGLYSGGTY